MIKAALFCDETKEYRCPEEPDAGDEVRLRFRTAADDVERSFLSCRMKTADRAGKNSVSREI